MTHRAQDARSPVPTWQRLHRVLALLYTMISRNDERSPLLATPPLQLRCPVKASHDSFAFQPRPLQQAKTTDKDLPVFCVFQHEGCLKVRTVGDFGGDNTIGCSHAEK